MGPSSFSRSSRNGPPFFWQWGQIPKFLKRGFEPRSDSLGARVPENSCRRKLETPMGSSYLGKKGAHLGSSLAAPSNPLQRQLDERRPSTRALYIPRR